MLDLPCLSSYRDAWWRILSCPVVGWLRNFSNSRIRRLFPFFTCPQLSTIPLKFNRNNRLFILQLLIWNIFYKRWQISSRHAAGWNWYYRFCENHILWQEHAQWIWFL